MQMVYDYQLTRNLQNEPSFISEYQTRKAETHATGIYLRHLRHLWKIKEFPDPERFHPIPQPLRKPLKTPHQIFGKALVHTSKLTR